MYFSFALYAFATVLVLVQGQEFHHEEPAEPHAFTNVGSCKSHQNEVKTNRMNAFLDARVRQVVLKPQPGYKFTPRAVAVKRCNGYCPDRWSPMPTKQIPKSFVVELEHMENKKLKKCVSVQVMEHMSCKCKCMRDASYCNGLQEWDQPNCNCRCIGRGIEKPKCESRNEMVWDDENCSCQCRAEIMDCPTGMHWNFSDCRCQPN